ncbi:probable thiopurine S-methyltransferase [Polypterus senegalus]|uniref:probable thiopurine S-methyltransferase n=1 Tax=Polypterus senegalus TaxID=55291 RepID=UPI001964DE53|nr:probable thiopurine S-methyltransferase [Polypterus senegalus]
MTDTYDVHVQEKRHMLPDEWVDRWKDGRIGFHQDIVHELLKKYLEKILNGRKGIRFFFPLCGKAVDMKWLADLGHTVFGVDVSEIGIKAFFSEQNIPYTEEPVGTIPGAKLFKSTDGKIFLYNCNLYDFTSSVAGRFDGIWDRGSLVAINPSDRQRYAALIISLMDTDCRYLLDTFLYNPNLYSGPPFFVPDETVQDLFGEMCSIQLLDSVDALSEKQNNWGIDSLTEKVHLLTLKKSSS